MRVQHVESTHERGAVGRTMETTDVLIVQALHSTLTIFLAGLRAPL